MKKKKKRGISWVLSVVLGFACALVLGALFYATMAYQLGVQETTVHETQATPAPLDLKKDVSLLFPGALLALPGDIKEETIRDEMHGGELCRIVTRTYEIGGRRAEAVSAYPAAYLSVLAEEGFSPLLITGFTLAGLDAVCEKKNDECILAARDGERVYLLSVSADEQTLYTLGAGALLQ